MDIYELTVNQLKRAAAIKEQIETLNKELASIFGVSSNSGAVSTKKRSMSASTKRKIGAAQKARWTNLRRANPSAAVKAKKKTFSPATRAKLSAKLKAYWAARKAGKQ